MKLTIQIALLALAMTLMGCGEDATTGTSGSETGSADALETNTEDGQSHGGETAEIDCTEAVGCDDDDPCTLEACEDGVCVFYDSNAPGCDANLGGAECKGDSDCESLAINEDGCVIARCNPDTNVCEAQNADEGATCDDDDPCTTGDRCVNGACTSGEQDACDDGDACTDDSCDEADGCVNTLTECSDDNPCTDDSCDPEAGCTFAPLENGEGCDDGDSCSSDDNCVDGNCTGTGGCDDGDPCTDDACNDAGECVFTPIVCEDDGNPCTVLTCGENGECVAGFIEDDCDDGDACTADDVCSEGSCVGLGPVCGDGELADEACGEQCDDGNTVSGDGCSDTCQDEEITTGCADDAACDDGNPCTLNLCGDDGECQTSTLEGSECDDGEACTGNDVCMGDGTCMGEAVVCGDGNLDGACGEECDDGNTLPGDGCSETCQLEQTDCVADVDCEDGNLCSDNSCVENTCTLTFNTAPCEDGDNCSTGDACNQGACAAGLVQNCDDGNECTADSCAADGSCLNAPQEGEPCDDGNSCTTSDTCGVTAGGSAICTGTEEPGCVETYTLCALEGSAGNTVECDVQLLKSAESNPDVVALQFDIFYEPGEITLENASVLLCPIPETPDVCFGTDLMPGGSLGTGHTLSSYPAEPAECAGDVTFILSKFNFPFVSVTDAFFDEGGNVQGDPIVFTLRFTLAQDATANAPAGVNIGNITASSEAAEGIGVKVENGAMVSTDVGGP